MLTLFIDESGVFEKEDDAAYVIGGLLLKHTGMEGIVKLNQEVKEKFINICGHDYNEKIHGKERNHKLQNEIIEKIINSNSCIDVEPVYITKGTLEKHVNSNITDDNNGCMLYLNMINTFVSTLLLHYPNLIKGEDKVNIFIASRVAKNVSKLKRKQFEKMGFSSREDKDGIRFFINNETSLLIHLNQELSSYNYYKHKIDINITKETINYRKPAENAELFYLADIVCNHVYNAIKRKTGVNLHNRIPFIYDDINISYVNIHHQFLEQNLYEFLHLRYHFDDKFANHPSKKEYDEYLQKIESNINEIINEDTVRETLSKVHSIVKSKNYSRQEVYNYLLFIGDHIDYLKDNEDKATYYDLYLQALNHHGEYGENSEEIYKQALEKTSRIGSFRSISKKREIMNRYATTLSNGFNFKESLELTTYLIDAQNQLRNALVNIDSILFDKESKIQEDLHLGKFLSSKGQFLSFLEETPEEAYQCFHKAIEMMKGDKKNLSQTTSYLAHFLAENRDIQMSTMDRELLNDYLQGTSYEERLNNISNKKPEELNPFQLFAFVKLYTKRLYEEVNHDDFRKLAMKLSRLDVKKLEHPWQLIFSNMANFILDHDRNLSNKLYTKAIEICEKEEKKVTIKLIGLMIAIQQNKDEQSVTNFTEYLKERNDSHLNAYFEYTFLIDNHTVADKIEKILSKFTYTYI
jgi:hypothetical protein